MNFLTKQTIESTARPGVRFTVRNLSVVERAERDLRLLDIDARVQELVAKIRGVVDAEQKPLAGREQEFQKADSELGLVLIAKKYPEIIHTSLISIEGLEVDGRAATVEDVIHCQDRALFYEVLGACLAGDGLSAVQEKNSPSPGTSPEAADGAATLTTADAAAE
jgi:hypothetical protein